MKRIIAAKLLVLATCLLPTLTFGQNLPTTGTWSAQTITGNKTVSLTGNVTINGTIKVGNANGETGNLTINNNTNNEVTIKRTKSILMFEVYYGSTLTINGKDGAKIVIHGGADLVWDNSGWEAQKRKGFKEYKGPNYEYIPLKPRNNTFVAETNNSLIRTSGTLKLNNVRIEQFYAENNKAHAIRMGGRNTAPSGSPAVYSGCGPTTLTNCEFRWCRSMYGCTIFVEHTSEFAGNTRENCALTLNKVKISQCMVNSSNDDKDGSPNGGGAIRFRGTVLGNLIMRQCEMTQNYATYDASCVMWNAGGAADGRDRPEMVLDGCKFSDNRSDRSGGAICIESGFHFEGDNTVFENNSCGHHGGAFRVGDYTSSTGTFEATSYDYNLNEKLTVRNNYAGEAGGGIAFEFSANILKDGFTFNINLDGMNVTNNEAGERGGGILFANTRKGPNIKTYYFNVYLNSGTISNNTAVKAGGGIFAREMEIKTNTSGDKVTISGNKVTAAEGVAGEDGAKGGGGGINLYDGTMHLNTCEITGNTVIGANGKTDLTNGYGGGIMLNRSTFTLDGSNNISGNQANVGGGVAALNETETEHTVSLTSGNINDNTANLCGGGVAIVGNVKMTVSGVNIKGNKAINAGGIYMRGRTLENNEIAGAGATLTYTGGQITGNMAKATLKEGEAVPPLTNTTAYQATTDKIKGIGGGICLGGNTTLEMLVTRNTELGIHDNIADNGADDVFCSGASGTSVVLPNVASMAVENGNRLFWVEDYITNDTQYEKGTAIDEAWNHNNIRYRDAKVNNKMSKVFRLSQLVNGKPKYSFNESYNGSEAIYQKFTDKYMCLTLGEVFTNIILQKKGMAERDNAIFKIYRWELSKGETIPEDLKTNKNYLYMTMILTDRDKAGDDLRRKRIQADYGYYYYIEETKWSWAYDSTVDPTNGVRRIDKDATNEESRTFTFTNTPKSNTPKHAESVKVNVMPGNK